MKRVLIAIPNFNNEDFIVETIRSVFLSTVIGFQVDVVVFDNCSTDNVISVLKREFSEEDINVIVNNSNIGSLQNHNRCIDYAISHSYDYLKILSSDDVLLEDCLQLQFEALEKNSSCNVVSCNMLVCDQFLNVTREHIFLDNNFSLRQGSHIVSMCAKKANNYIGGPSNVMIRVASIHGVRFDPSMRWLADLKFSCLLIIDGCFINIGRSGIKYRRHPNTDSSNISSIRGMKLDNSLRFCKEFNGGVSGVIYSYKNMYFEYLSHLKLLLNLKFCARKM